MCKLTDPLAWLRSLRAIPRVIVVVAPFMCLVAASALFEPSASARAGSRPSSIDRYASFVMEASTRFAVPALWIRAIIQIESAGDEYAISPRGAMGLMQLMPATWVDLSARIGLGLDPFDPRDNISAGTACLKEMHDRFGFVGFVAAYHAGPARYEQYLAIGQPLPLETLSYVAAVTPLLTDEQSHHAVSPIGRAFPSREAPLFIEGAGVP